jgi:hypothetical protein
VSCFQQQNKGEIANKKFEHHKMITSYHDSPGNNKMKWLKKNDCTFQNGKATSCGPSSTGVIFLP